jgi:DNA-binding SARP family transcriptional activator
VLGPLQITAAGREIGTGLRKARELLAFLAVHPDGATGEAISEALWPGAPPGHGTRQRNIALRKARELLRGATGLPAPMWITLTAGRYRLDPALAGTDLQQFQAALEAARIAGDDQACLAALRAAVGCYRGPLADGAGYDWAEPYAETARRRFLDAWARIAEILQPCDPEQALAALEAALTHDPYNEYTYQQIMRLQAAAGRADAVRRTLALLETRLGELEVTPGAGTRRLAATLLGTAEPPGSGTGLPAQPRRPSPGPGPADGAAGRHR